MSSTYDKGFYPTPVSIMKIFLSGIPFTGGHSYLDPSAGEGAILDYIKDKRAEGGGWRRYTDNTENLYAIEIDRGRQAILRDKGYSVIDTDFLAYNGLQYFDYILINPPFDDATNHLLHAWEIANGATIRCLVNLETIRNPHTPSRKRLVNLIKRYGWYKSLGQAFRDAERKTDVFVALVHLVDTRKKERFRTNFEPGKADTRFEAVEGEENGLVSADVFESYEARFNAGMAAFKKLLAARQEVKYYLDPILRQFKKSDDQIADALKEGKIPEVVYAEFIKATTRSAWDALFDRTKLSTLVTQAVQADLEKQQREQGRMAFTAANMNALFEQLFLSREQIMVDCVKDAFLEITQYYKENRLQVEGWATNSSYKVQERFILPNMGDTWGHGLSYQAERKVSDIEKALSFITGKRYDDIVHVWQVYDKDSHYGEKRLSEFFETKLYKKGTLHFRFLDKELYEQFNIIAAKSIWGNLVPEKTKEGRFE